MVLEEVTQIGAEARLHGDHHLEGHLLDHNVVHRADQETTDPLPTGAETLCLLQVEDLLGVHLGSHEEDPHRLTTDMMTMAHLLIAGTHRGTTTVVVTANVKGKDLRAIAVIIILAGILLRSVVQAAEVAAIPAVTGGMVHPWTEGMEPLIDMALTTEAIHQIVVIVTGMEVALRAPPRLTATLRNEEATLVIAKIAVDTSPAAAVAMGAAIEDMEHLIEAMGLHLIEATDPHRSVQGLDMGPRQIGPTQQGPTPLEAATGE